MTYVIVAFTVKDTRSVFYKTTESVDELAEALKDAIAIADFISIRKVQSEEEGTESPQGWKPWRNGRGESKPADADPELAQFLEENRYRFGNRWASDDGYEYWLSTLNDGTKFIHRTRRSRA